MFPAAPRLVALILLIAAGLTGCATAPRVWTEPPPLSAEAREALNLKVFDRVVERVEDKFFDEDLRGVDWEAATRRTREIARVAKNDDDLYAAINGLLMELGESHTVAIAPRDAFDQRSGYRVATGFMMRRMEGNWVIVRVYPGSAAESAGVRPGWVVRSRNGAPLAPASPRFKMRPGQEVRFEFLDADDRVRALTLVAGPVDWSPRRESRVLEDGSLYLHFEKFDMPTIRWLSSELERHRDAPGAIVDLRDNPGGLLMSARFAIAEFFARRVDIGTFVRRGGRERDTGSLTWGSARFESPVVVLVNEGSASSSEIFAHVLQHYGRAVVIGRRTAGEVIAAIEYRLPDQGLLQIAIMDYVGLDGERLEGRGVTPDVSVEVTLTDLRKERDPALEDAREALHEIATGPTT